MALLVPFSDCVNYGFYSPDKNPGIKDAHERFARLGIVAQILRNKEGRERYVLLLAQLCNILFPEAYFIDAAMTFSTKMEFRAGAAQATTTHGIVLGLVYVALKKPGY